MNRVEDYDKQKPIDGNARRVTNQRGCAETFENEHVMYKRTGRKGFVRKCFFEQTSAELRRAIISDMLRNDKHGNLYKAVTEAAMFWYNRILSSSARRILRKHAPGGSFRRLKRIESNYGEIA